MLMQISSSRSGDSFLVRVSGEVDLGCAASFREHVDRAVQAPVTRVVVDLCDVVYLDSTGLGILVGAHKRLSASGRRLVVRTSQPRVLRVIKMAGLTRLLTVEAQDDRVRTPA